MLWLVKAVTLKISLVVYKWFSWLYLNELFICPESFPIFCWPALQENLQIGLVKMLIGEYVHFLMKA